MDKRKSEYLIAGVLVVALIALIGSVLSKKPKSVVPAQAAQSAMSMPAATPALQARPPEEEVKKEDADADDGRPWGRDPFVLKETGEGGSVISLKVMGITTTANKKYKAIINNEIVGVDSKIGKYKVVRILKDRVTVTDGKENFDLLIE